MRELRAILVLAVLLAAAWWGYQYLFEGDDRVRLQLVDVEGDVVRVTGLSREAAREGDLLAENDRIQAGKDGRAVLTFGADTRVTVENESSVQVTGVTEEGIGIELENGKVHATVRAGGGRLSVGAEGRELSAEDADFTAIRRADGVLAVEGERGEVQVRGVDGVDRVAAGSRMVAARGGSAVTAPVNEGLLLDVVWPDERRTRLEQVEVKGVTEPGATVRLRGRSGPVQVAAGPDGRFAARVTLEEGENTIEAVSTSVFGEQKALSIQIVRDTVAPTIKTTLHP